MLHRKIYQTWSTWLMCSACNIVPYHITLPNSYEHFDVGLGHVSHRRCTFIFQFTSWCHHQWSVQAFVWFSYPSRLFHTTPGMVRPFSLATYGLANFEILMESHRFQHLFCNHSTLLCLLSKHIYFIMSWEQCTDFLVINRLDRLLGQLNVFKLYAVYTCASWTDGPVQNVLHRLHFVTCMGYSAIILLDAKSIECESNRNPKSASFNQNLHTLQHLSFLILMWFTLRSTQSCHCRRITWHSHFAFKDTWTTITR